MVNEPHYIGGPSPMGSGICTYEPAPGGARCTTPATMHFLADLAGEFVALLACAEHASIARMLSFDEHPAGGDCDFPNAVWVHRTAERDSYCVWDEGQSIAQEFERVAEMATS